MHLQVAVACMHGTTSYVTESVVKYKMKGTEVLTLRISMGLDMYCK